MQTRNLIYVIPGCAVRGGTSQVTACARLAQVELGKRMGYSDTLISFIERVRRPPTRNFAVKADEVFETGGTFVELFRRITQAALLEGFEEFADAKPAAGG